MLTSGLEMPADIERDVFHLLCFTNGEKTATKFEQELSLKTEFEDSTKGKKWT